MNNLMCPCVFNKKLETKFAIIVTYVDDLNFVRIFQELTGIITYLKTEFEIKDLEKQNFFLTYKSNIFQMEFYYINQHIMRKS